MQEYTQYAVTELQLSPRKITLVPNVTLTQTNKDNLIQNLKEKVPKISKVQFKDNQVELGLKMFSHWNSVKEQVHQVLSRELDPDYVASVEELEEKLSQEPDESLKAKMIIRSVINPVLKQDGGSCEFKRFTQNDKGERGVVLKFQGACGTCPSSQQTLQNFIQKVFIQLMPELSYVENET